MIKINPFKGFSKTFWAANSMELFERWAWYGLFVVIAIYLTGNKDTGALGFTQTQKGLLMGTVSAILYFLPIITGAMADRWGYKRILLISFGVLSTGYFFMAFATSFISVFFSFLYIGFGAALFKPIIAATIAKTTTTENSSMGFGIYYLIINIGGFFGPFAAAKARLIDWQYVFFISAAVILINILVVLFFYKEPPREKQDLPLWKSMGKIFHNIYLVLKDGRFSLFLIIIVGFWTVFWQLYYSLPNFIEQWTNTHIVYDALFHISSSIANFMGTAAHGISPELMINLDAAFIIIFQLGVSVVVARLKPIHSIIYGIAINSIGVLLTFLTANGLFVIVGIFIFAIGEMASSPKITEYIGKIAPREKTALYIGTSFLPVAAGNFFAGILSGPFYGLIADKYLLAEKEIVSRRLIVSELKNMDFNAMANLVQQSASEFTQFLWIKYAPWKIGLYFAMIGILTSLLLVVYNKFIVNGRKNEW